MQQQQQPFQTPPLIERMVRYNVMQPLAYPTAYSKNAFIPILRCLAVYGRRGNHIGDAIRAQVAASGALSTMVRVASFEVDLNEESTLLDRVESILDATEESPHEPVRPTLIIVEGAELWVTCPDYVFQRRFAEFDARCRASAHCIVVLVFHAPPSEMPPHIRATLMANATYFPSPNDAWRQAYFKHIFTTFADHVERQGPPLAHLRFALTDDDYAFLSDCATNLTPDQIRHWCEALFIDLFEMRLDAAPAAPAGGSGGAPAPTSPNAGPAGVSIGIIDLDFLKKNDKLHSIAGIEWQLLVVDGNALENKYSIDAGIGALAVRDAEAVRARKRARDEADAAINVTDGTSSEPQVKRQIMQGDGTIVEESVTLK